MLTLDDAGMAEDLARVWNRRPHVFRNALLGPVFQAADFFSGVVATAESMLNGRPVPSGRLALNGKTTTIDEAISFVPLPSTQSFEEYEEQIRTAFRGKEFSIVLDKVDVALPNIRRRVSPFLHSVFDKVGYPVRGIHSCVYAGNYAATPFGIHMDDCHVLMAAGIGRKSMAFWPRDYFEHRRDLMNPGAMAHIKAKVSDFLHDAVVHEIGPYDLLYWPAGYWHVGVSDAKDFHAALSIGIYHKGDAAGIVKEAVALPPVAPANSGLPNYDTLDMEGLRLSGHAMIDADAAAGKFTQMWNSLRAGMLAENAAHIAYTKHALSTVTSVGFGPAPDVEAGPIRDDVPLAIDDARFLAWKQSGATTLVGANGRVFAFDAHQASVESVFERIKRGDNALSHEVLALAPDRAAELWAFMASGGLLQST